MFMIDAATTSTMCQIKLKCQNNQKNDFEILIFVFLILYSALYALLFDISREVFK